MQLSNHFSLDELVRSDTAKSRGIDNTPGPDHLRNLGTLVLRLEEVRALLGKPMLISSGYRSPALNAAVGGSGTSDHAQGLAADFVSPQYGAVMDICRAIEASGIKFDQLIFEQGATEWVHFGLGPRMRRQVMSWSKKSGYVMGLRKLER